MWVLTGDKTDTAIEIGFSCNLLTRSQNVVVFEEWEPDDFGIPPVQRAFESDEDPRVIQHVRGELMRLLREMDERPDDPMQAVYGPPPVTDPETRKVNQLADGTLDFPGDPAAAGCTRSGLYPEDWPLPTKRLDAEAAELQTVFPHIMKRPLKEHPLAMVMHAAILRVAMDPTYCGEHRAPV